MVSTLKSLTFTPLPKIGANPTLDRRKKIIARLEEQKRLLSDPGYVRTVRRTVKQNGERTQVEKHQRIFPWWRPNANGSYVFFVRAGWKPIEFEKGKAGISVPSLDKMTAVIDAVIAAVRNGELDEQLAQSSKKGMPSKSRKTA